jgi:hypothetical protein
MTANATAGAKMVFIILIISRMIRHLCELFFVDEVPTSRQPFFTKSWLGRRRVYLAKCARDSHARTDKQPNGEFPKRPPQAQIRPNFTLNAHGSAAKNALGGFMARSPEIA